MWPFLLLLLAIPFPGLTEVVNDPAPGVMHSKAAARNLDCKRLGEAEARARYPGAVSESPPRGSFIQNTQALACTRRIFALGERPGREEAILSNLSEAVSELAAAADDPSLAGATWLVDAFYPDQTVAGKLSFATKVALAGRGRSVSDRVPVLAAGDLLVLGTLPPTRAYPLACQRYWAEGSLTDSEVLLGVVLIDEYETILHTGVCHLGVWRWVQ